MGQKSCVTRGAFDVDIKDDDDMDDNGDYMDDNDDASDDGSSVP